MGRRAIFLGCIFTPGGCPTQVKFCKNRPRSWPGDQQRGNRARVCSFTWRFTPAVFQPLPWSLVAQTSNGMFHCTLGSPVARTSKLYVSLYAFSRLLWTFWWELCLFESCGGKIKSVFEHEKWWSLETKKCPKRTPHPVKSPQKHCRTKGRPTKCCLKLVPRFSWPCIENRYKRATSVAYSNIFLNFFAVFAQCTSLFYTTVQKSQNWPKIKSWVLPWCMARHHLAYYPQRKTVGHATQPWLKGSCHFSVSNTQKGIHHWFPVKPAHVHTPAVKFNKRVGQHTRTQQEHLRTTRNGMLDSKRYQNARYEFMKDENNVDSDVIQQRGALADNGDWLNSRGQIS